MKKTLVLLVAISMSGTAFAQRGFDYDSQSNRSSKNIVEHPFIREMSKSQQEQLSALKEQFLKDSQVIEQKYEKEIQPLRLELKKLETLESQMGKKDDSKDDKKGKGRDDKGGRGGGRPNDRQMSDRGIPAEHVKMILQMQEIKMQMQALERKSKNEIEDLKMSVELASHKIYQEWADSL